ncbi:MAG: AAA family ATPase [Burkholderiales bacterium]|nr:AAA family ATPase [Burkholderiales bacterium]
MPERVDAARTAAPNSPAATPESPSAVAPASASVSAVSVSAGLPGPTRLRALLAALGADLLERDEAVHLALLAALAGEHVLLIGPPGTAKSALARRLHGAFAGVRYFERLLTRFSTPEELFGPLSLKALEHDRYERLTEGFLPTAGIAFLDEVFKANSAILNALLTLLNERLFDNGTERAPVPLVAVVAASNEVPDDEALHAFYDRFLVRVPVSPVGDAAFGALLALPEGANGCESGCECMAQPLTAAERAAVGEAAAGVALTEDFVAACTSLRAWLAARMSRPPGRPGPEGSTRVDRGEYRSAQHEGAPVNMLSDRRWRQIVGLARVAAASEGRAALDAIDLWLAPYVASAAPADVPALMGWFEDHVLAAPPAAAAWLERAVAAFEKQLGIEQQMPAEDDGAGGPGGDAAGKLALARAIGLSQSPQAPAPGEAGGGIQRIVSQRLEERLEARLHKRWGALHVQARVAQVAEIEAQVAQAEAEVRSARGALAAATATRLWMPPVLLQRWLGRYDAVLALLAHFAARLRDARQGFAALPVDEAAADEAPAPVAFEPAEASAA